MDVFFVLACWRRVSWIGKSPIAMWKFCSFSRFLSICCCTYHSAHMMNSRQQFHIESYRCDFSGGTMLSQLSQCANIYLANTSYAGCAAQLSVRKMWILSSHELISSYFVSHVNFSSSLLMSSCACWTLTLSHTKFSSIFPFLLFTSAEYRVGCFTDIAAHRGWLLHWILSICKMYKANQRKCAGKYMQEIAFARVTARDPNASLPGARTRWAHSSYGKHSSFVCNPSIFRLITDLVPISFFVLLHPDW